MKLVKIYLAFTVVIYFVLGIANLISVAVVEGNSFWEQIVSGLYIIVCSNAFYKLLASLLYAFLISVILLFVSILAKPKRPKKEKQLPTNQSADI